MKTKRELGMTNFDDQDDDDKMDDALLEPIEGDEGEPAMRHTCAACGETNTILPPRGHRFVRKSKVEREFEKLDEAYAIGSTWRESYRRALQRPSCPLPM